MTEGKMIEVLQNKLEHIQLKYALTLEELEYQKYMVGVCTKTIWFIIIAITVLAIGLIYFSKFYK